MIYNLYKVKDLGKIGITVVALTLVLIFHGCIPNEQTDDEWWSGTEWLYLRVLHIYDDQQNNFMTACNMEKYADCHDVQFEFQHLHLPDIGVDVGSHIRVEVALERIIPDPAPLFIYNWELID